MWLRRVFLQDIALIYTSNPQASLFHFAPLNTLSFRSFASKSTDVIAAAEKKAREAFQDLPQHLVRTLQGVLIGHSLDLQRMQDNHSAELAAMRTELVQMKGLVELNAGFKSRHKKKGNSLVAQQLSLLLILCG